MKNNIDKLYENINENEELNPEIIMDIELIDNVIVDKEDKRKKELLFNLEKKYEESLNARQYFKIKGLVATKTYMVNNEKELNTLLGNLKVWLVRIAYLEKKENDEINKIYNKIAEEKDKEKIYKYLDKADGLML